MAQKSMARRSHAGHAGNARDELTDLSFIRRPAVCVCSHSRLFHRSPLDRSTLGSSAPTLAIQPKQTHQRPSRTTPSGMATLAEELAGASVGFVGAGNMAWAIFQNILASGVPASQVTVSAPSDRNLGKWKEVGAKTTHQNGVVIENSRVVILALKPQQFQGPWQGASRPDGNLFISVMAGMSTESVEAILEDRCSTKQPAVVRTMPNTPIMVGQGATVLCHGQFASAWDVKITKQIFGVGNCLAEQVPEGMMDAAGALVGCGPAFVYQFLESLCDGAVAQGVPRDLANRLTAQMVAGAAKMVQETAKHPGLLKDEVCSPAGTTIAGLHALRKGANFSVAVMDAIEASTTRSKQLNSVNVSSKK